MAKVVFNKAYGGYDINANLMQKVAERKGVDVSSLVDIPRHDPDFVAVVEEAIKKNENTGFLAVWDIGNAKRYWIDDYDGYEEVHTDFTEYPWIYIKE